MVFACSLIINAYKTMQPLQTVFLYPFLQAPIGWEGGTDLRKG